MMLAMQYLGCIRETNEVHRAAMNVDKSLPVYEQAKWLNKCCEQMAEIAARRALVVEQIDALIDG